MKKTVLAILLIFSSVAFAWWPGGHQTISRASIEALPNEVPEFFRSGSEMIAHCSIDPDLAKDRKTPHLRNAEYSEHYIDYEYLDGRSLPPTRYEFIQLCAELDLKPEKVGFVTYAIAEWTERLAIVFAEHRKSPNNPYIQQKCLVYAGIMSHYAQDISQPLHNTIHYDGIVNPDGSKTHKGIHEKVDASIQRLKLDPHELAKSIEIDPFDDLMDGIIAHFSDRFAEVDRVYELADLFPPKDEFESADPEMIEFVTHLSKNATKFNAQLFLTAWKMSEKIELPSWIKRKNFDKKKGKNDELRRPTN